MRNIFKKICASFLALVLCLSFAGCYSEDKTWAAKKGDDTLPIGSYIYYLTSAYSEAASKISSDTEVLKGTVDDKSASEWIKDKAMEYLNAYYYINGKFSELGLELTEDEKTSVDNNASSAWSYYKETFEGMGIAQSSFKQAYSLYNAKYQKVLEKMYGEGGELEVPSDELKSYYTENYYSYEYFYAPLTKNGDDGNSQDLTDDEKAELKSKLEGYADKINLGETTVSEAASDYSYESSGDGNASTYNAPSPAKGSNINSDIFSALSEMKDDEARFVETSASYYVIKKLSIEDKFAELKEDESQMLTLLLDLKGEEFSDYVLEQGKSIEGVEINEKALNSINLSTLVQGGSKNGTSSASSAAESSEASTDSSAVSSEASSALTSSENQEESSSSAAE